MEFFYNGGKALAVLTIAVSPLTFACAPGHAKVLHLGSGFNQEIEGTNWPNNLGHLTFRQRFDRNVESVRWPKGMRALEFGNCFDRPIERVDWPPK